MNVNYDSMLEAYNKNLETNLRDFKGGPPPFEEWCPYEGDDVKSVEHLIDLAKSAGNEVVTVTHAQGEKTYKSERALKAEKELKAISKAFNTQVNVWVVGLKKNVLTIDYQDSLDESGLPFHEYLIKIEGVLNKDLGESFDIQTLNVEDKNIRKAYCKQK